MRPFEGIKILDCTHVLAGPFAAYQIAVLGADVIKVDDPNEPVPGIDKPLTVPLAAFTFARDGPSIERPPARVGEHTDEVLAAIGYTAAQIAALRRYGAIA